MVAVTDLALPERLTHAQAQPLIDAWTANPPPVSGGVWALDARAVSVFDSSAVAAVLALRRLAVARGLRLSVTGCPPRLLELAALYGVAEWFQP